jgi:hypothetical protein
MDTTYTIRALDGNEYGPASLNDITQWIREGRVNQQTEIKRSDMDYWSPAAKFAEVLPLFAAAAPPPPAAATISAAPANMTGDDPQAVARLRSGASWFYWIAGLSIINSIAAVSGGDWRFIFGLGVTQLIDALGKGFSGGAVAVTLVLDVLVTGMFVLFGVFAHKRHLWAFIVGGVLFLLDTFLILLFKDWIGVAFHAWVLFSLFVGAKACQQLNAR